MARATHAFHNRLAVVFDFDLTLGEGSIDVLLDKLDVDPENFRKERIAPLDDDGWDHSLARFKALIDLSEEKDGAITEGLLREVGRDTPLYPGVEDAFDRLREAAEAIVNDVEVEFYVLTAGFAEVPSATSIAGQFRSIWGSAGHYADDGRLIFPKRVVTYPEKVRYLLQLAKNIPLEGADAPADVYRPVPDEKWRFPLDQMIYVGDGASDLPAFDLMEDHGGIALGVVRSDESVEDWDKDKRVHSERRIQNLAEADYTEGAELMRSLTLGVESIAKLIRLRKMGQGE